VEYGWGARSIDVDNWVAKERPEGPSMWGHDRVWLPDEVRENARKMRMGLAQQGYRRPVQVIEGRTESGIVMPSDLAASHFTTTVVPTDTRA